MYSGFQNIIIRAGYELNKNKLLIFGFPFLILQFQLNRTVCIKQKISHTIKIRARCLTHSPTGRNTGAVTLQVQRSHRQSTLNFFFGGGHTSSLFFFFFCYYQHRNEGEEMKIKEWFGCFRVSGEGIDYQLGALVEVPIDRTLIRYVFEYTYIREQFARLMIVASTKERNV